MEILGTDPIGSVVFVENLTFIATYLPSCVGTDPIGGVLESSPVSPALCG